MADNLRLAGTAFLSVDGTTYPLVGDFEYMPSNVSREPLIGMDGVHGYTEKPIAGYIKGTLRDAGGFAVADLNAMVGVNVTVVLANGKTINGHNMWQNGTEGLSAKSAEATIEIEWGGIQGSVTERLTRTPITVSS